MKRALEGSPAAAPSSTGHECERMNFLVYRDAFGGWRWEFRQANGHYIDSKESYESEAECVEAAHRAASTRLHLHR
jgi:uncharacterized protein YegP (UPF0339 family)